jgi:tRNA (guanine-N7-)-methyltransferase
MTADSLGRRQISWNSSSAPSEAGLRERRHWGRRKGPALSTRQAGLFDTLLPRLAVTLEPGRDPRAYFSGRPVSDVWLEVGFGGGEHLAWQAEHHPDIGHIGAEPYVAGMAKLLSKIDDKAIGNIRLYAEDAHDIVSALPDASIARVFILFPDPWPKTRHHKRRFIQMEMLGKLARLMKPGAELRFATDDAGYLVWALERLMAHPTFMWLAERSADWRARVPDWPETRYEAKALRAGCACTYLRFRRV